MDPEVARLHRNGVAAMNQGQLAKAERLLMRAVQRDPNHAGLHASLASLRHRTGQWRQAAEHGQRFLILGGDPPDPAAHLLTGDALYRLGRISEALPHFRRVTQLSPASAGAWRNLGVAHEAAGETAEALACFGRAIARDPQMADVHHRIAALRYVDADYAGALEAISQGLRARETPEGRALFAQCLAAMQDDLPTDPRLRDDALRALTAPWGRPTDIACVIVATLHADGLPAWDAKTMAASPLLLGLLTSTRIADAGVERVMTGTRRALLDKAVAGEPADADMLELACALARQCFLNEYVYATDEEERRLSSQLRDHIDDALLRGLAVDAFSLAVTGACLPLQELTHHQTLLARSWSPPVAAMLQTLVAEPLEERALRQTIPALTPVTDRVSREVQAQYEENPYPRWTLAAPVEAGLNLNDVLRNSFPDAPFQPHPAPEAIDILIAGCGTGRVAQEIACRFATQGRILGVDLSAASLAYAARQARRAGVAGLAYAQADILALPELGLSFDLIDVSGVLHHMADPLAAWRLLLSILRPGGCMRVGLYSALARQDVSAAQRYIADKGDRPVPDDIRRRRQDILEHADDLIRAVTRRGDFYSLSECRDLLFHVHEVQLRLPDIAAFIADNGLTFLGFDLPAAVQTLFDRKHPYPAARHDLQAWIRFEEEHPLTFSGMYQLWVQKPFS